MAFFRCLFLVVGLSAAQLQIALGRDIDQLDVTDLVGNLISGVVRPGFADLENSASTMLQQMRNFCEAPTSAGYVEITEAFGGLMARWGRVEFMRLGPLSADNRLERMLFWPDRRGRGLKQVRDIIRLEDTTALDPKLLAQKSVAVQGLLALEYALFADGAEAGLGAPASFRCAYASAIAGAVSQLAGELNRLWQLDSDTSISHIWLNPSPTNALFRDEIEQFAAVLRILEEGFEIVSHQRLEPILRDDIASARPKSALFWRSHNTIPVLIANLDGFGAVLSSLELERQVEGDERRTLASLGFELGNARRALSDLNMSSGKIVSAQASYDRLAYARIVVESMLSITRDQIKPIFGLSSGFSSLDGD